MKRVIVLLFSLVWITSFTTTVQAEGVTNIKKYDSYLLGISRLRYLMGYTR